ncbi:hypothetical protein IL306_003567 [Fusarium sp. DS 682]|nr:hypothetical protein IL306_003567 [Fusarium sp. DS 682]
MNVAIDELELAIERDDSIRDLLSPTAQDWLADFAIIVQTLNALDKFEPWNSDLGGLGDSATKSLEDKTGIWGEFKHALEIEPTPDLIPLGEPTPGKFTYPLHRRRNKENVDMMRKAEANLDAFWARADQYVHERTEDMDDSIVIGLLKNPRALQRTPEWVEPTKEKKQVLVAEQPLSPFFVGLSGGREESGTTDRLPGKPAKTKFKTRGVAIKATETDEAAEAMAETTLEEAKPIFKVDRRALKTFRSLFHNPDNTSMPGEVAWNDFLHALISVGFAAEKLYGSVWQFLPASLEANASIHFHEPHPKGKLPFVIAKRYGRRLNRTYGWTGEQFVLGK